MTHRFINADGLVSTGTGILGHNMFAYCGDNPINSRDDTGTWPEWLETFGEKLGEWYNRLNDELCDFYNKFTRSIGTVLESVDANIGLGYGLGFEGSIFEFDFSLLIKCDLLNFTISPISGFDIGSCLEASVGCLYDLISWENVQYNSYIDSSRDYSTYEGNVPNKFEFFSVGFYFIFGGNITFNANTDYIINELEEIWRQ